MISNRLLYWTQNCWFKFEDWIVPCKYVQQILEHFLREWLREIFWYHQVSWTIFYSLFKFIYPVFREKISDINISRSSHAWVSPIPLRDNVTFIFLENNIFLDLTSLFFQEYNQPQIIWNVLTHTYQFCICWALEIDSLFLWYSMDDPISHWYGCTCVAPHDIVHSIWCINPG